MHTGDEVVRERAIRLIHTKMKTSTAELLNKESQAETIAQIKKVFASGSVTAEEFPKLLSILQMTFLPKSTTGQAELVNMITKMADLDQESETVDFDYSSTEAVDRLIHCANQVNISNLGHKIQPEPEGGRKHFCYLLNSSVCSENLSLNFC